MDLAFDKKPIYRDLVFALPMKEGTGTILNDYAKSSLRHTMTATGTPTWTTLANGLQVLDFNPAHPDYLQCSAAGSTDLDFTSGAFSGAVWLYADIMGGTNRSLINRGGAATDGWFFYIYNTTLRFGTYQAGASQLTRSLGLIALSTWYLVCWSRIGPSIRIYINGLDANDPAAAGSHTNPLTANRKVIIGVDNDEVSGPFDGKLFFPRIWSRALAPEEVMYLFQTERKLLGV